MAARNNPLIVMMGLSFDSFNLLHRWFGRIVVIEALVHTLTHLASSAKDGNWGPAVTAAFTVPFLLAGAVVSFLFLSIGMLEPGTNTQNSRLLA